MCQFHLRPPINGWATPTGLWELRHGRGARLEPHGVVVDLGRESSNANSRRKWSCRYYTLSAVGQTKPSRYSRVTMAVASGESGKTSCSRVELQQRAQRQWVLGQVDPLSFRCCTVRSTVSSLSSRLLTPATASLSSWGRYHVLLAQVLRDVAQVAKRCRQVAFPGVGVQILGVAAGTGVDEIAEVVAAAFELLDHVHVLVVGDAVACTFVARDSLRCRRRRRRFCCPCSDLKSLLSFFVGRVVDRQASGFEHDALVTVVVDRDFGVRRIAGVDVVGDLSSPPDIPIGRRS